MADGHDGFEKSIDHRESGGGAGFMMGLLTGTVLGAGLGMLFAPKAGSELRGKVSERAGNFADQASTRYRRASDAAAQWAERGRDVSNRVTEAVAKGTEDAQKYVRDTVSSYKGSQPESFRASSMEEGEG